VVVVVAAAGFHLSQELVVQVVAVLVLTAIVLAQTEQVIRAAVPVAAEIVYPVAVMVVLALSSFVTKSRRQYGALRTSY
jgi:hypothetical protein